MSEPTGSLLSKKQRKLLKGEITREGQARERMEGRIFERILTGLVVDGPIVFNNLDQNDRKEIFETTAPPTHAEASEEERKEEKLKSFHADPGISDLIAFLYEGLNERDPEHGVADFENALKIAMGRVADQNGWVVNECEFTVEFNKTPELDEWQEKFEAGEATIKEALELRKHDKISENEFVEYAENYTG